MMRGRIFTMNESAATDCSIDVESSGRESFACSVSTSGSESTLLAADIDDELEIIGDVDEDDVNEAQINPAELAARRWKFTKSQMKPSILWCGVARDDTMLAQVSESDDPKIHKIAERLMRKSPKTGFDFKTYAIQSQNRTVKAAKFHIYQKQPLPVSSRAKIYGLQQATFMNGATVRILEYRPEDDKYLIRPTVPLPKHQQLSDTGRMVVASRHLAPVDANPLQYYVWTYAVVFDSSKIDNEAVCAFIEKIVVISTPFREDDWEWQHGGPFSQQHAFAPVLQAQVDQIMMHGQIGYHDHSLELSNEIIAQNILTLSAF